MPHPTRRQVLAGATALAAVAAVPVPVTAAKPFRRIYRVRGTGVRVTRSPEYLNQIAKRIAAERRIIPALRHRAEVRA